MLPNHLAKETFQSAFSQLSDLLHRFEPVWRSRPFIEENMHWQAQFPELSEALLALSDDELEALSDEDALVSWMSQYLPDSEALAHWSIMPFDGEVTPMAKFVDVGIPGRKVEQITRFASVFKESFIEGEKHILDWCSGKGHLAKQLHFVTGSEVTCLEYNGDLCEQGEKAALKTGYPLHFVEQDVLQPIPPQVLAGKKVHTGLHACGDLHLNMIQCAVEHDARQVVLSPCCYHLTAQTTYQGLSQAAKACPLQLTPVDLRLAVSQTVTAGNRVRLLRQKELLWRIAFDLLHRKISGSQCYRPTPSIQKKWLSGSFDDFCVLMAERIGVALPQTIDTEQLMADAGRKHAQILRLEKARLAFRRAMEYYLVLDRVLFLQEQGFEVSVKLFCEQQVTARNILISATRHC